MIEPLVDLAAVINQEHALTYYAVIDALEHAITCGENLIEARKQVPEGEWTKWVKDNLDMTSGAVSRYIRIATYKDHLLAAEERPQTIGAAVNYLKAIEAPRLTASSGMKPHFDVEEARRLRNVGIGFDEIGEMLGVTGAAIHQQLMPDNTRETIKRKKEAQWVKAAEARAEDQARVDSEVAAIPGRVATIYEMLRNAELLITDEMEEADVEASGELRKMLVLVHRAEDTVTRMFGIKRMRRKL